MTKPLRILVVATALLVLAQGATTPARAAEGASPSADAIVGDFGLGDGLEGGIDWQTGAFTFAIGAGGVPLAWDSARLGGDRHGLGPGWSWRVAFVDTEGGVRVFPTRGGVFEADASSPSGLYGYPDADLVFEQQPGGRVPARAGVGEREFAYVLHELGGVSTFFAATGDAVARISATGQRFDWSWSPDVPHRLIAVVNPDGVRTELDWLDDRDEIRVRPAVNVGEEDPGISWRVRLHDNRVAAVIDPLGGRVGTTTDAFGLVTALESQSGATTEIQWRAGDDGTARVDRLRIVDAAGELSRRTFSGAGTAPSGWPARPTAGASGVDEARSTSELSDGRTRIVSTSNSLGLLVSRRIVVSTPSGDRDLQEQRFAYPATDDDGRPRLPASGLPAAWSVPTSTTVVHADATGATRDTRQTSRFDEFGRPVLRHDGTEYEYDAADRVIRETSADGTVIATEYWADGTRRQRTVTGSAAASSAPPTAEAATTYYWDGGTLVNEVHAGSPVVGGRGTASYLLGVLREARTSIDDCSTRETRYAVADRHGSITELVDAAGSPVMHFDYGDYGVQLAADGSPEPTSPAAAVGDLRHHAFRFAGEFTDGDGTQYLRTRIYDPVSTRFLTKDRAERQNLYHFADANPIVKVDPSGREPQVDFGLAMAGLALGVGSVLATPFTGGSTLALFGSVATAAFDIGVAAGTVVDQYVADFLPDDWAFGLAVTATVVGFVGAVVSLATVLGRWLGSRAARRIGTNVYEGVPIVHDGPPRAPRSVAPVQPPRPTLFDDPLPLTTENLNRPQSAFQRPLSRTPSEEQLSAPTHQIAAPHQQMIEPFPPSVLPSPPRPRASSSAPALGRSAQPATSTTPGTPTTRVDSTTGRARQAVIEAPVYVAPPGSDATNPIQYPLLPDDGILPRSRGASRAAAQPMAGAPSTVVPEQGGSFSGMVDWVTSAFTSSGPAVLLTGSPTSQVLYAKFNLY